MFYIYNVINNVYKQKNYGVTYYTFELVKSYLRIFLFQKI